jgi:hypothetical protein
MNAELKLCFEFVAGAAELHAALAVGAEAVTAAAVAAAGRGVSVVELEFESCRLVLLSGS